MLLRSTQAAANNSGEEAPLRWEAIRNNGVHVGYPEFEARWEQEGEEGILHKLVDRFDGNGLVIKTTNGEDELGQQAQGGQSDISRMAKHATQLGK